VCFTGISQEAYRAAVREGADIVWYCASCHRNPIAESTRDGETSADILESEEFNPPLDSSADNFQDQAQEAPAYNLQEIAETTVRALARVRRRQEERQRTAGGLLPPC